MNAITLIAGMIIGATFADVDLAPVLPLRHRSAWTHGALVPALLAALVALYPDWRWFVVGFLPAYAVHLWHDMFPKKWHGSAKISLFPLPWRLPALLSFLFLLSGVVYSLKILVSLL